MVKKRFRILVTSCDYRPRLGGIATLTYELAEALWATAEAEVRVLAPADPRGEEFDHTAPFSTRRVRFLKPFHTSPLNAFPMASAIAEETVSFAPDAILNILWIPDGLASLIASPACVMRGIPYYIFGNGVELIESSSTLKKRIRASTAPLKRAVFHGAKGVFAISEFSKGLLVNGCGVPASKISMIAPGVHPADFYPEPKAPDLVEKFGLAGRKVFVTVSRLEDYKGVDRAIAAMRHVKEKHPEALYLICGEGPDRSRLESLVRHYRVQDQVRFAGMVPHARLRDHYNLADAFVLLTRENWEAPNVEGFGIVFIEAGACGKPSIGGNSGGIPCAQGGSEYGWLVDPHDDRAVASAMLEVIENPEEARRRGEAARQRAVTKYTWSETARKVLEAMKGPLKGEPCAG